MSKPLILVKSVNADGVFTRICLDFDSIFGMSPHQSKIRLAEGPQVVNGTILMFKNGKEMFVTDDFDVLQDQWINLTHACVLNDEFVGTCKCGEQYVIKSRKP
jgi:hypothetical protein